jgi:hypothetical protein
VYISPPQPEERTIFTGTSAKYDHSLLNLQAICPVVHVTATMPKPNKLDIESSTTISGPHTLFNASFILEILKVPSSLDAT